MIYFYVSPSGAGDGLTEGNPGSLADIKTTVSTLDMQESVTIWVRGGVYSLTEEVMFGAGDSGKNGHNIIWRAYPNEIPVFSGGLQITGWSIHDAGKNIYSASVPSGSNFRNIWVNGTPATRSFLTISDSEGYSNEASNTAGWIIYSPIKPAPISRPQDLEGFFTPYPWTESFIRLSGGISGTTDEWLVLGYGQQPDGKSSYNFFYGPSLLKPPHTALNRLENAYEFMTTSTRGVWYLNRGTNTLFYQPRDGEDIHSAEVIIPILQNIIVCDGLKNTYFVGMEVSHADWFELNDRNSLHNNENMMFFEIEEFDLELDYVPTLIAPGAVEMHQTENVKWIQPTIRNVGNQGIRNEKGVINSSILGGSFSDIGGVGVWNRAISGYHLYEEHPEFPTDTFRIWIQQESDRNTDVSIVSNKFRSTGLKFPGSSAILVGGAERTTVSYNDIGDVPWSGISLRGNAGRVFYPFNHNVFRNKIHDFFQKKVDGGAFFSHECMYGTKVFENHIYNIPVGPLRHVLMLDQGPLGFELFRNVIEGPSSNGYPRWFLTLSLPSAPGQNTPWYDTPLNMHTQYPNLIFDNYVPQGMIAQFTNNESFNLVSGTVFYNELNQHIEAQQIIGSTGLKLVSATEIIDGQSIIYGWGEGVQVSTTDGTIEHFEETDGMWRATVTGLEDGTIVTAQSLGKTEYLTIGKIASPIKGIQQLPINIKGQGGIIFPFNIKLN